VREGFTGLLHRCPDFELVWQVGTYEEAITMLEQTPPDLLITDITLPDGDGLAVAKLAAGMQPAVKVLVMSIHDEVLFAPRALRAGAKGYMMKSAPPEEILDGLRIVANGGIALSATVSEMILMSKVGLNASRGEPSLKDLSDREFEIFQLVGEGLNSQAISAALGISSKTVDVHKMNIRRKLVLDEGVSLTAHAIRWVESRKIGGQ
jgi:DNA-binding NarL/FixJ family response regulator